MLRSLIGVKARCSALFDERHRAYCLTPSFKWATPLSGRRPALKAILSMVELGNQDAREWWRRILLGPVVNNKLVN
jgi:hypothetical protein